MEEKSRESKESKDFVVSKSGMIREVRGKDRRSDSRSGSQDDTPKRSVEVHI